MVKKMSPVQWVVTVICMFLMFGNKLLPGISGLNEIGSSTIYIFAGAVVMMMAVGITWPPFLAILAFATNGIYPLATGLQMSMGHNVMWVIIFSGIILGVLTDAGLLRRIAIWLITRPFAKKSPFVFFMVVVFSGFIIGCFMDPTVTCILMFALANEILTTLGIKRGNRVGEVMMLSLCSFIAISYCATTLGHSVPLTVMSLFEEVGTYNQLQYLIGGIIVSVVYFVVYMLVYKFVFRLNTSDLANFDPEALKATLSPASKQEKIGAVIYAGVIVLWLLPSCLTGLAPEFSSFMNGLGPNAPLIAAIFLMAVIRVDGKPLLDVTHQIKANVPWTAAILVGVNMLLGSAITNTEAGISEWLTGIIGPLFSSMSPIIFVALICLVAFVVTQFTGSMLTATLTCAIALPLISGGVAPGVNPGALAFCISVTTALGWGTPPSGAWAALIAGQGWVRSKVQLAEGIMGAFIGTVITVSLGYPLMCVIL